MSSGPHGERHEAEKESEIFRNYLERQGVMETWTQILAELYERPEKDRPSDVVAYISDRLSATKADTINYEATQTVSKELRTKVNDLLKENKKLREKIEELENRH